MRQTRQETAFQTPGRRPWHSPKGLSGVLDGWLGNPRVRHNLVLDESLAPRPARHAELPVDLAPGVAEALSRRGVERLYGHQAQAYGHARAGRDLVVATPTASGKSLCFNLPVMQALSEAPEARALYLYPTKALSRDQEVALGSLLSDAGLPHGAITYDGDTPADARRAARQRAGLILTNPDMLHAGILPHHANWARLFANLRYVVVDELHTYRGVFGSHLANVLRRLDRIARFHGSRPVFLMASATIGNPREHGARMIGRPVTLVDDSGAPAGPRRVMVYNPPVVNAELGIRESYLKASVRLTSDLVEAGVSTLVFGQSRNNVEVMLKYLREGLARAGLDPQTACAYRGGYLPGLRRDIERSLREGALSCVVATNALELGIDIGALDAVVCAGYPGTQSGLWQRFGRGGRRGEQSLCLLVSSSAPLDQYVARQGQHVLGAPIEHARIDPDNAEILVQHLKCASFELPFEAGECFGDVVAEVVGDGLDYLADHRLLHPVAGAAGRTTYHWASDSYPANDVSLRSLGWDNFVILDLERDETLAEMDWRSTHTMLHEQAIYQHGGEQYQVERLDFENHKAFVRKVASDYFTNAMTHVKVSVIEQAQRAEVPAAPQPALWELGDVSVVEKVVGYKKIKYQTHENVGYGDIRLPEMQMHTTAAWLILPEPLVLAQGAPRPLVLDALRGLGNAVHMVATLGLMIDPGDLGHTLGDRTDPDGPPAKGAGGGGPGFDPTLFFYDRIPGGIGLSPRLFDARDELSRRARALIETCDCDAGCPACVGPPAGELSLDPEARTRKQLALSLLSALGVPGTH